MHDNLDLEIRKVDRKRRVFSVAVLSMLVVVFVVTSVYSFAPTQMLNEPAAPDPANQIAELEQVVQAHPKDVQAIVALGNHYFDAQRFADAAFRYDQALALDPGNPDVRTDFGTTRLYQKQPMEAISAYRQVLETHPRHVNARVNLGLAYKSLGQSEKAAAEWHDALALTEDPAIKTKVKGLLGDLGLGMPKK